MNAYKEVCKAPGFHSLHAQTGTVLWKSELELFVLFVLGVIILALYPQPIVGLFT